MGKTAGLAPVVVNEERIACEGRIQKPGNHHPVVPHLPGAHHVEKASNHDRQPELGVVGQGQELINRLAAAIRPTGVCGRAKLQVVVFVPAFLGILPVHLTGRCQKKPAISLGRQPQQQFCRVNVRLDGADGIVGDQADSHRGGEMINHLRLPHDFRQQGLIGDRTGDNLQPGVLAEMRQIVAPSGREIVEDGHRIPAGEQGFDQVTANESRTAGDQTVCHRKRSRGAEGGADCVRSDHLYGSGRSDSQGARCRSRRARKKCRRAERVDQLGGGLFGEWNRDRTTQGERLARHAVGCSPPGIYSVPPWPPRRLWTRERGATRTS